MRRVGKSQTTKKAPQKAPNEGGKKIDLQSSQSFNDPEEDHYFSSAYNDTAVVFKTQDIKQKLLLAYNITQHCKETKDKFLSRKEQDIKIEPTSILKQLHDHTNLPESELKPILDSIIQNDRSYETNLKEIRYIPEPTAGLLADDIRSTFIKYIIEENHFPSKKEVLEHLEVLSRKYSSEIFPIPRLVKNKLIQYHHFPEFNKYLLTEHPESVYHRTIYLKNMHELRLQQRNFVYVEVRKIIPRGSATGFMAGLAAFPSINKIDKFFTKDSNDPKIARKWLQQRLLPLVPERSVVVLAQPKKRTKLTPMSKRADFIAWLNEKGIPYGENTHTAELYNKCMKYKGESDRAGVYDYIFLNTGLTLVQFPSEWRNLSFFKFIWEDMNVMDAYHMGRPEALKQKILNATTLLVNPIKTEEHLIEEELKMMAEDIKLESINNVFEMIRRGDIQSQDLPQECSGNRTDNFDMNLSEFLLDIVC